MATKLYAAPAVEPVTLQEAKDHLRLDGGTFADRTASSQTIAPGLHVPAASYSLKGTGVNVSAARNVLVILECGTNLAGGTVDVKLQESDTDSDSAYTDVASGTFSQVTTATDNSTFELAYTGRKTYLRAVATVASANCEFGVSVILDSPTNADDTEISRLITAARRICEAFVGRAFVTQTWDLYLDEFPSGRTIAIPYPPLQSITTLKYKDTAGTLQTWAATNYIVDTVSEPGRVVLAYGIDWPAIYDEIQAVQIRFVAGYGLASAVPEHFKQAVLLQLTSLYEHRGDAGEIKGLVGAAMDLMWPDRIIPL